MKKILLSALLVTITGCSAIDNGNELPLLNNDTVGIQASKNRLPALPNKAVFSVFNNAYKGLFEENEVIGREDPNNTDKYFFKAISSATQTLDLAFFDIYDPVAVDYILQAKARGVNVRVLTDTDNLKDKDDPTLPRKAITDMQAAGIEVKDDKRGAFMHHKFMIVDNNYVWLGSMNPTTTSMYDHNNNCLLIRSPQLAENYNTVFKKLFERGIFNGSPDPIPNPIIDLDGSTIKTYFSPKGGTKAAIVEELKKAQRSIRFMAFSFTDKEMGDIMVQKKQRGLIIEGVFDTCLIDKYSMYNVLKSNKISVLKDGNQALMHSKTIIIDNETVITGSYNFSASAENSNNEDTLIINSYGLASNYTAEFFRVKNSALNNKDLPPYDHPACSHKSPSIEGNE